MTKFLTEFEYSSFYVSTLFIDNKSEIEVSKNPEHHRHILIYDTIGLEMWYKDHLSLQHMFHHIKIWLIYSLNQYNLKWSSFQFPNLV